MERRQITKAECLQWIADLRSGEYKQGQDSLYTKSEDSYCCLGVLASKCMPDINWKQFRHLTPTYIYLPDRPKNFETILVIQNDVSRKTFAEIADYIQDTILPLLP